jgi:DNA-binding GntR family transcriptional regulator
VLPQRGTRVARIDMDDCREAMFFRRALETEAMRTIAPRADATLLATLDRNLREQQAVLAQREQRAASTSSTSNCTSPARLPRLRAGEERGRDARAAASTARGCSCARRAQGFDLREHEAIVAALKRHDAERRCAPWKPISTR